MMNITLILSTALVTATAPQEVPSGSASFARLTVAPSFSAHVVDLRMFIGRGSAPGRPIYWATMKHGEEEFSVSSEACPGLKSGLEALANLQGPTVSVPGVESSRTGPPRTDGDVYTLTTSVRQADGYPGWMELRANGGDLESWGAAIVTTVKECRVRGT